MGMSLMSLGLVTLVALGARYAPVWAQEAGPDNSELLTLADADQRDRQPATIDWSVVTPRDRLRLARVKALYSGGAIRTGTDFYRAALILQHGETADDYLLAHEFCVAAMRLGKNDVASASLAAAAEDRFLVKLGRPQRYGTQYRVDGTGTHLHPVDGVVRDDLRALMGVASLATPGRP